METKEYKNGHYRFDEGSKMKQFLDDMWDERVREEILEFHCWNLRNKMYCPKDWRDFK
jgi:hypothetical protein